MSANRPLQSVSDGTSGLHTFLPLAFRLKKQADVAAPRDVCKSRISLPDNVSFLDVGLPTEVPSDDESPNVTDDDGFFDDEDILQSNAQRRTRRLQAKRISGISDRPLRVTIGGRIGKTRPSQQRRTEQRHRINPIGLGLGSRSRRLLPSRQFLRRKAPAVVPVPSEDILDAILAIPGFSFSVSMWMGSSLGSRLGRLLADPNIVRKCGHSLKRRRLPNFLLTMLAFPIRAHHGRGIFERDCGYAPGDEHDLAFWRRFAGAFGLWLGLDSKLQAATQDEELDPFFGGAVLRDLTTFLSSSRARFLGLEREPRQQDEQLALFRQLAPQIDNRLKALRTRRRRTIIGEEADDDDDDNGEVDACDVAMQDDGRVSSQTTSNQPTQLQRRVSVATDAWVLFLEKSREVDFDLDMLAAMCI
ncbi:hypothetical protein CMQ_223 [Grosmannia clavigera kw1407]|uniref:Uncharacterized protein n=1 Tax=Grosmannia clavigera (strain kw1407 / UAMH 11150) TaxID=655863 RepID=F0XQW4_GROCL|nr:uncharacterized protein CMQ_223 [Grosmannia clavigera kw1407]EFW99905.1 hypothetical protein CMQ_223 [Grosmannia clavigera kw1407]